MGSGRSSFMVPRPFALRAEYVRQIVTMKPADSQLSVEGDRRDDEGAAKRLATVKQLVGRSARGVPCWLYEAVYEASASPNPSGLPGLAVRGGV